MVLTVSLAANTVISASAHADDQFDRLKAMVRKACYISGLQNSEQQSSDCNFSTEGLDSSEAAVFKSTGDFCFGLGQADAASKKFVETMRSSTAFNTSKSQDSLQIMQRQIDKMVQVSEKHCLGTK